MNSAMAQSARSKMSNTSASHMKKKSPSSSSCESDIIVVGADDEKTALIPITIPTSRSEDLGGAIRSESLDLKVKKRRSQPKELKKVTQWTGASDAALEDEPFYHGYMARTESERIVTKDGEFLVRKAEVKGRQADPAFS
ncbi:hypothetical protein GCK32_016264 [Trichostrongylus colubriformis]|uniref:SH2 domain-containing protein n=1 Tax=Trichostrongylus colubriformis TaxID=6319 RepID=A0AAN8F8Z1_TRICO